MAAPIPEPTRRPLAAMLPVPDFPRRQAVPLPSEELWQSRTAAVNRDADTTGKLCTGRDKLAFYLAVIDNKGATDMLNILCVILAVALAFWLWRSRLGPLLVMTCFIGLLIADSGQPLLVITLLAAGYLMSTLP